MTFHTEVSNSNAAQFNSKFQKSSFKAAFLLYHKIMLKNGEKLGAFIVPTGIGASIGGYAEMQALMLQDFQKYQN